ncbi:ribosome maturation factor RimM [Micromonosporaceae bacterium DT55]|uniref:ribosome maturation factor RimM n=1 Tax=Melissospora conviva TaxID=3388432 RepID=UPI003C293C09
MLLVVGRIGKPHGIRGEVTVEVRTDEPEARFVPGSVLRTEPGTRPVPAGEAADDGVPFRVPEQLKIESARWHQGRMLVVFADVFDRNVAEALRGTLLWVDSSEIDDPEDPDEFHDHQLVGLTLVDPAGEVLGEVTRIDHSPASDLLVVRRPDGATGLVPFVSAIVTEVDLAAGRIVADPPPGLFDL